MSLYLEHLLTEVTADNLDGARTVRLVNTGEDSSPIVHDLDLGDVA